MFVYLSKTKTNNVDIYFYYLYIQYIKSILKKDLHAKKAGEKEFEVVFICLEIIIMI